MIDEPEWGNSATIPVLELLDEAGVALSPGAITLNLELDMKRPPSRSTVTRALKGLLEHGFVEKPVEGKSYYRITESGERYLY